MAEDEFVDSHHRHAFDAVKSSSLLMNPINIKQIQQQFPRNEEHNEEVEESEETSPSMHGRVHVEPNSNTKVVEVVNDYFDHSDVVESTSDIYSDEDESSTADEFRLSSVQSAFTKQGLLHGPGAHEQQQIVSKPLLEDPLNATSLQKVEEEEEPEENEVLLIDIDTNLLPLSSPQENNERNIYFRSIFDVPETEKVVEEVYCAYYKKMPNQGRMYISQNFVCFTSNIFGYKINLVIPFSTILVLEKRYTAIVVPSAIEIICKDGQTHFFGSFVFRDQTFKLLEALWNLHQEAAITKRVLSQHSGSESTSEDEESVAKESDEEESGESDEEDSDSDDTDNDEKTEEQDEEEEALDETEALDTIADAADDDPEESSEVSNTAASLTTVEEESETEGDSVTSEVAASAEEISSELDKIDSLEPKNLKVDSPSSEKSQISDSLRDHPLQGTTPRTQGPAVIIFSTKPESTTNGAPSSKGSKKDGNEKKKDGKDGKDKNSGDTGGSSNGGSGGDGDDGKKNKKQDIPEDAQDDEEEEEEENNYNDENFTADNFDDMSQIPASEIFPGKDKYKPKDIASEVVPVSARDFFFLITGDGSEFENTHHLTRGDTDFQVSPWVPATDGIGKVRDISFVSAVNNPIGPKTTRVKMIQRLVVGKGQKEFVVQSNMSSLDVPYADCFRIIIYIYVKDGDVAGTCSVRIELGVFFLKSTILKWKIEDSAFKETNSSYLLWFDQAKQAVVDAKAKGKLYSQIKGKGKKGEKSKKKPRKKSSKKEKKPRQVLTVATPVITHTPAVVIQQTTPSASSEESTLTTLLTQALGFLFNLPETLTSNVSVPVWLITIMFVLFLAVIVPQQNRIIASVEHMQKDLQAYKLQTTLFEVELNNILFNMSTFTDEKQQVQIRHRKDFEDQLREWYKHKSEIQKHSLDNYVLQEILFQLENLKKGKPQPKPSYSGSDATSNLQYQQHIMMASTNSQLSVLTWTLVGVLIVLAIAVVLKLLVFAS